MSLSEELQDLRERGKDLPLATRTVFEEGIQDLSRSGIVERSLKVGDRAPEFELPDFMGRSVRLADLLQEGPVVISFYRGGWCPFCTAEMKTLQRALPSISSLGATVVAISPQTLDCAEGNCTDLELEYIVLGDSGNRVAGKFGIVYRLQDEMQSVYRDLGLELPEYNDDDSWSLPIPATYVLDRDGKIRLAFVDPDYTRRLDPTQILATLSSLAAEEAGKDT